MVIFPRAAGAIHRLSEALAESRQETESLRMTGWMPIAKHDTHVSSLIGERDKLKRDLELLENRYRSAVFKWRKLTQALITLDGNSFWREGWNSPVEKL
jgi:hypothetical protein